jgi:predicted deacylase
MTPSPVHGRAADPRHIGSLRGPAPGPTIIVIGAVHGNEPAGLMAGRRLLSAVKLGAGALHVLVGNLAALERKVRYVDGDLNRRFENDRVRRIRHGEYRPADAEDHEQLELIRHVDRLRGESDAYIIDLHTFSAPGSPFAMASSDEAGLRLAAAAGLPTMLHLERFLRGTMVEFAIGEGLPVLAIEGGQHDDPDSVEVLGDALVKVLAAIGAAPDHNPFAPRASMRGGLFEVIHRHAIGPLDDFRMRPGFSNLEPVRAGQHLADDRHGPIRSPGDARLLMPLYQGQGADGFFLAREVAEAG